MNDAESVKAPNFCFDADLLNLHFLSGICKVVDKGSVRWLINLSNNRAVSFPCKGFSSS